jgi:uncharacterized damage-inducible protein DinB
MHIDTIRLLYDYNYWAHRQVWACVEPLSEADYRRPVDYSMGSVHEQITHVMSAEWIWFSRLRGTSPTAMLHPEDFPDRATVRARWDEIEGEVRAYLGQLTETALLSTFEYSRTGGQRHQDRVLDILLHVVNHGTDHRAQILELLHTYGAPTIAQDLIFYLREQAQQSSP